MSKPLSTNKRRIVPPVGGPSGAAYFLFAQGSKLCLAHSAFRREGFEFQVGGQQTDRRAVSASVFLSLPYQLPINICMSGQTTDGCLTRLPMGSPARLPMAPVGSHTRLPTLG